MSVRIVAAEDWLLSRCKTEWRNGKTEYRGPVGFVYFIAAGYPEIRAIKIGYSRHDPRTRMGSLQTANHENLILLAFVPGNVEHEAELQDVARDDRIRGEWFHPSDYLLRLIETEVDDAEWWAAQ